MCNKSKADASVFYQTKKTSKQSQDKNDKIGHSMKHTVQCEAEDNRHLETKD